MRTSHSSSRPALAAAVRKAINSSRGRSRPEGARRLRLSNTRGAAPLRASAEPTGRKQRLVAPPAANHRRPLALDYVPSSRRAARRSGEWKGDHGLLASRAKLDEHCAVYICELHRRRRRGQLHTIDGFLVCFPAVDALGCRQERMGHGDCFGGIKVNVDQTTAGRTEDRPDVVAFPNAFSRSWSSSRNSVHPFVVDTAWEE